MVSLARQATAAAGLNGFTIEELCEQAGISRRTFFNYFASKEDAVLGIPLHTDDAEANALFVGMRPRTAPGTLSASLLTDLAALIEGRWAALEFDQASAHELMAAAEREPRLVTHMLERHHEDEKKDVALVARREGLSEDDPRAAAAVQIVGHLARLAVPASLDPDDPRTFAEVLEASLDAAREVFATQSPSS
nr:TetR/AcrR family transcriptional regulator [Microbacterium sp. CFH 90308]